MRFYENYFKKEEIIKRTKKYGFPQSWLVELLVYDFEIFRQLLKISKSFVLKGGAAAQTYLPLKQQRASVDIDLITSLKPNEIKEIFMNQINKLDFATVKIHKPKKFKDKLPLITYLIDLPSITKEEETIQLKVDILFEEIESYKVEEIKNKELFALKIENKIPCIKLGSLVADKLLTLASKSIGIDESRQEQLPKHVYDLIRLMDLMKIEDFNDLLFSFEKISKAEMRFRGISHELPGVIEHIKEILIEFAKVDIEDKKFKKLITDFQSAYVNRESRKSLQEWAIDCLKLNYLVKVIKDVLVDKKDNNERYNKFVEFKKEFEDIVKMSVDDKKSLRENLLKEANEKLKYWKFLKGKSEERIFLELKQLDW